MNTVARPQRRALTDWTVDQLYELVFTGDLPAGADLGEELISQRLSVSRATTSAALRQLERDGLAVVAAGNGRRVVVQFDAEDVADLYAVRATLEVQAARQAAINADRQLGQRLCDLQTEMEARALNSVSPSRRDFGADFDFHDEIVKAARSPRLRRALLPLWNQTHALLRHLHQANLYADAREDAAAYADHRAIMEALAARDADAAAAAMAAHLSGRGRTLIAGLSARSGPDAGATPHTKEDTDR